ncbi:MAG: glycoside hydrolase family 78 protein [Clostridiales bacterium]|nr:glycoside hydrolase family 78 protein [Clostridiales bacterium]
MTQKEMFGDAKWVAPAESCTGPYIRGSFNSGKVKKAEITICGLGFFELYINGKRVGDDLLVPANSQYEHRNLNDFNYPIKDELSYRTYCMKYDVDGYISQGENTIGVMLGCGWYNQYIYKSEGDIHYGRIKLCYKLEIKDEDGNVNVFVSDEKLKWAQSEVLFNNIYAGEIHDYSFEHKDFAKNGFDVSSWNDVEVVDPPKTNFYIQTCPTDKKIRTCTPKVVKKFADTTVYDIGEAISGWAVVIPEADGDVKVRYAEQLFDDFTLSLNPTGGRYREQKDEYKNAKKGVCYYPRFCWHAFRYIEVTNNAKPEYIQVVHSDCAVTSSFNSNSDLLNWLYKTYLRTQLDNMHCGVPSDCPHIERLGYTGDGQLCAESVMLMTDSREFYRKWMEDVADCQDINSGHVQHTAPFCGGGGGPAGWGGAIVVVPYMFYRCFGEKDVLERYLPNMLKYADYMVSRCENGLVWHEEDGGWCLGDWCAPMEYKFPNKEIFSKSIIPETYVNTTMFIKQMQMITETADILGKPEAAAHLKDIIEKCKRAVTVAYYSPMYGSFAGNVQGASCFALDAGMGDEKTLKDLVEKYKGTGAFDTGIFATDILPRILFENGQAQLAFDLITSKEDISFHHMMVNDATTLWEDWWHHRSLNHPMFGALTRYLFMYLLGIRQPKDSCGFEKILIAPCLVNGLDWAAGHITTVRGKIAVSFVKHDSAVDFTVTLDEGMDASFELNGEKRRLESGKNEFSVKI